VHKVNWGGSIVVFFSLMLSGICAGLAQPSYQNLALLAGFDGSRPLSGLVRGPDGYFYGATSSGGDFDKGTLFRVGPDGNDFQSLYHFTGAPTDGDSPRYGTLAQNGAGGYYGTTFSGGTDDAGTLFRLDMSGQTPNVHVLFSFPSTSAHPYGSVILARDGLHLYGTTGAVISNNTVTSHGSVFGITTDGSEFNVIHTFSGADGSGPLAGVIEVSDGLFYGTTEKGGAHGKGTLYRVAKDGTAFQTLYDFPATGGTPVAGLIEAADGRLYGVAPTGGGADNPGGFLFSINRDGTGMVTLHSFSYDDAAGVSPSGGLVQNDDGSIFGTTRSSSTCPTSHCGSIFRYQPSGAFTTIHPFADPSLGATPQAQLTLDAGGNLYGSTSSGGDGDHGTAFVLALPHLDLTGPAQVDAGGTATYSFALSNTSALPLFAPQSPTLGVTPALSLKSESSDAWTCNTASPGQFDCSWNADLAPGAATGTHSWTFDVGNGPYAPYCGTGPSPCLDVTASDPATGQAAQVFTPVALKRPDGTPNGFPQAHDDGATLYLPDHTSVIIDVLDNDSDPDGDPLTVIEIVTSPTAGTAVINNDGTVTYSPSNGIGTGTDQFRYRVADDSGASTTALATVTFKQVDLNLSKSRLDIGNVPTGRLAAGRFWVDATPIPYKVNIRFSDLTPSEIDDALIGTGYDRAQTQSDTAAFAANECLTAPDETSCLISVYFVPTAPAGKVSIARAELTLIDGETLRPMANRSIIVIGRSALESESPVLARDDTFTVTADTPTLISPLLNDATAGPPLYFAGVGVCNFAPFSLGYAPCATHSGTTNVPVVGTSQFQITPAPGFTGTNAFLYGVAQEECVNLPNCRYQNTIYYAVVTVNVVPAAADVELTLVAPSRVSINTPVTVSATIKNNGPNPATSVSLSGFDSITVMNPMVTASAGNCTAPMAGRPLECALGTLAPGASANVSLVMTPNESVFPPRDTSVTFNAKATVSAHEADSAPENNQAATVFTVLRPELSLPPRISTAFEPTSWQTKTGSNYTFSIVISNAPDAGRTKGPVTVTDLLPTGLTFDTAGSSSDCTAVGQLVTCSGASGLAGGFHHYFRIGVTVAVAGLGGPVTLTNRMTSIVTPNDFPPKAPDQKITVIRPLLPRISASFEPETSWQTKTGADFTFFIVISNAPNAGPTTGPVTVTDLLPEGLTFAAANSSPQCTAEGQVVTCSGASRLAPGSKYSFRIGTTVAVAGLGGPVTLTNRMTSIATPNDFPAKAPDQKITVIRPLRPRTSASFEPETSWNTRNGATFTFFIVISNAPNAGPTTGPVTVTDLLPEGLTFDAANSSTECTAVGQVVTCSGASGLPGGTFFHHYFRIGTKLSVSGPFLPAHLVNRVTSISTPDDRPPLPHDVTITVEPWVGNTPVGQNVAVQPTDATGAPQPIVVAFAGISSEGSTTATALLAGFPSPAGFEINGLVYDIVTTATYTAPVTVCFDGAFTASSVIQHGETDATGNLATWNILPNQRLLPEGPGPYTRICADSNSLSPFAVMQRLASEPEPTVKLRSSHSLTFGQTLKLFAKVKGKSPVGTITFVDGETPLGYVPLRGGKAVLRINGLNAGIHDLAANYSGDVQNNMSRSATLKLVIKPSVTRTKLSTSNRGAKEGETITLTAHIKGANPAGIVSFMDDSHLLGTSAVIHNNAALTGVELASGTHRISASYSGDLNHKPSISQILKQRIIR